MNIRKTVLAPLAGLVLIGGATACTETDSDVVRENLKVSAEQFELVRRIVFYNGITDKYMFLVEGRCSVDVVPEQNKLDVTCKMADGSYKLHNLGQADNVTWFSEQLESENVSADHYRVIFKPESIIKDIDRP